MPALVAGIHGFNEAHVGAPLVGARATTRVAPTRRRHKKDVDGRDKRGHDGHGTLRHLTG